MKDRRRKSLVDDRYGKLLVIEDAGRNQHDQFMWKCRCDCGNELVVVGGSLRNGNTKSCGCIHQDKVKDKPEHLHQRKDVPIRCGIYRIVNPDGEVYIGHSRHIYRRWIRHRDANKEMKICYSIKKFGWRAHDYAIEHELPTDVSDEELIMFEQAYIDFYRVSGFTMMNVKDAGSKAKFPEESKLKMSMSRRGRPTWNKGLKGAQAAWNKGLTKKDYPSVNKN